MSDINQPTAQGYHADQRSGSGLPVNRRDVLKAAGAAGIIGTGVAVGAQTDGVPAITADGCDVACGAGTGPDNCACAVDEHCEYLSKVEGLSGACAEVSVPEDATLVVVKAGQDCIVYGDDDGETLNPGGTSEICISEDCQGISHVEFYECISAEISVDCGNDQATVAVENTDSVYYEVAYDHCDEADTSGTVSGSGDSWSDTVSLADCEGTIDVWATADMSIPLDSAGFDCETASVSVACENESNVPVATISAEDTELVNWSVTYDDGCSDASGSVDLSGDDTDSADVTLQNCPGTISLTDDDDRDLGSATFEACDCGECDSGEELLVKYEWEDGEFVTEGSDGSISLSDVTLDDEGEPTEACFTSHCDVDVVVKAGTDTATVEDVGGDGEFCVSPAELEMTNPGGETPAISYVAFYCEAPEDPGPPNADPDDEGGRPDDLPGNAGEDMDRGHGNNVGDDPDNPGNDDEDTTDGNSGNGDD